MTNIERIMHMPDASDFAQSIGLGRIVSVYLPYIDFMIDDPEYKYTIHTQNHSIHGSNAVFNAALLRIALASEPKWQEIERLQQEAKTVADIQAIIDMCESVGHYCYSCGGICIARLGTLYGTRNGEATGNENIDRFLEINRD